MRNIILGALHPFFSSSSHYFTCSLSIKVTITPCTSSRPTLSLIHSSIHHPIHPFAHHSSALHFTPHCIHASFHPFIVTHHIMYATKRIQHYAVVLIPSRHSSYSHPLQSESSCIFNCPFYISFFLLVLMELLLRVFVSFDCYSIVVQYGSNIEYIRRSCNKHIV